MTPAAPLVHANGAAIPAIGLGTWQLRGQDCAGAVRFALEAGYRHVDTAAMYGNEEAVGQGLRASSVPRDEVFVTTKIWHDDLAPGDLERSAEASLGRLGVAQVDLLLIHWPNPDGRIAESIGALCGVKRRGLTRHIGISNFPVALIERAVAAATEPLVANQCEYHPRLGQRAVLAACRRHGLAFASYAPLGRGGALEEPVVAGIAARHGKSPAQVVLRWHVQQPGVVAIPKSGNRDRIRDNLAIFDFHLSEGDMKRISALARPDGRIVSPAWAPAWDGAA